MVEHNLIYGTTGYNAQFKHQRFDRNTSIGIPSTGTVIIRDNVFSKETGSSSGARHPAQPSRRPLATLGRRLLGPLPDLRKSLVPEPLRKPVPGGRQHRLPRDNLLVNRTGDAVRIQPHYSVPRRIDMFNNTVVATGTGIYIFGADSAYTQRVVGNAVFAGTPLNGGQQSSNVTGTYAAASTYLNSPMAALGSGLDLYPKTGQLQGTAIDYSAFTALLDYDHDFNSRPRIATYRGAYSGSGVNPGWTPALAIKPQGSTGNVLQNGVPVPGLSGATDSQQFWTMSVPAGASNLLFQTSGGTGDADLYVRFGAAPTLTTYDCGPVSSSNDETCSFPSPAAGTWHVMVHGWAAYSGATLVGS